MTPVFLDTVGLLALWDSSDQWHAPATVAFRLLVSQGRSLTTTSHVLFECGNAAARRTYRGDVVELRGTLLQEGLLIEPTKDDVDRAWEAYRRRDPGAAGIVDEISFVVMERLGITDAFTNDRHFRLAGFHTLF